MHHLNPLRCHILHPLLTLSPEQLIELRIPFHTWMLVQQLEDMCTPVLSGYSHEGVVERETAAGDFCWAVSTVELVGQWDFCSGLRCVNLKDKKLLIADGRYKEKPAWLGKCQVLSFDQIPRPNSCEVRLLTICLNDNCTFSVHWFGQLFLFNVSIEWTGVLIIWWVWWLMLHFIDVVEVVIVFLDFVSE